MINIYKSIGFVIILFSLGCVAQKEIIEELEIEYNATTRGSYETIKLVSNKLTHITNKTTKEFVLANKNQAAIEKLVSEINLLEMHSLKSPSNKRFSDGAMHATLSIKKGNIKHTSSNFDHGNPPEELKSILNFLYSLVP